MNLTKRRRIASFLAIILLDTMGSRKGVVSDKLLLEKKGENHYTVNANGERTVDKATFGIVCK